MFKNRKMGHIGVGSSDTAKDAKWMKEELGYEEVGHFTSGDKEFFFMQGPDVLFELFPNGEAKEGPWISRIDHFCYESKDIDADYEYAVAQGYKILTPGVLQADFFWEKGIRFFKFDCGSGNPIEFCQVL